MKTLKNFIQLFNLWSTMLFSQMVAFLMENNFSMHLISMTQECYSFCMVLWTKKWHQTTHLALMPNKPIELTLGSSQLKTMMVDSLLLTRTKMINNTNSLNSSSKSHELINLLKYSILLVPILLVIYWKEWVKTKFMMSMS